MKHYKEQLKHFQALHLAAVEMGEDKLADEYQLEINNYKTMQSQVGE